MLTPDETPSPSLDAPSKWLQAAADEMWSLGRTSTAERVADVLRRRITEGGLLPGTRLSEERYAEVLRVSRNTLREAFRLLTHERLLVHELHRGVFVAVLDEADLVDLYRLRRTIECDVVRSLTDLDPSRLRPLKDEVVAAESAAKRGDWVAVGTANMRFHRHLVGLAGSRRIDEVTERLLAELRLAFYAVASPQHLHAPYVERNRAILELLEAAETEKAANRLGAYLHDSQTELIDAVRSRSAPALA